MNITKSLLVKNITAIKTFDKKETGRLMEVELRPGTSLHNTPRLNERAEFVHGGQKIVGTVQTFLSKTAFIIDTFKK